MMQRKDVRILPTAQGMFKIIHEMSPRNLHEMYKHPTAVQWHETRRAQTISLYPPEVQLHLAEKSFRHRGIKLWEQLPNWDKEMDSYGEFEHSV